MPEPILPHVAEDAILAAVSRGELEIREDGTIWRIGIRRRHWRTGKINLISSAVTRADRPDSEGYREVSLSIDGLRYVARAHRLVYRYFKGPIPDGLTINHEDGVKSNNLPPNLEPMTQAEQYEHARDVLCLRLRRLCSDDQVAQIRVRRKRGESLRSIADAFGIFYYTVSQIARRQTYKHVPISAEERFL